MPKSKEFVSSSEDSGSDSEPQPKAKKRKAEERKAEKQERRKPEEKPKASSSAQKGSDGEQMFQISRNRYATVSEFRGKVMVSIREYYEADGDLRPGKKGITLPLDQWNRLKDQIDDINQAVKDLQ